MACEKRNKTGICGHGQCPFPDENPEGVQCIDIDHFQGHTFCEIGEGCLDKCPHSWQPGSPKWELANRWQQAIEKVIDFEMAEHFREMGELDSWVWANLKWGQTMFPRHLAPKLLGLINSSQVTFFNLPFNNEGIQEIGVAFATQTPDEADQNGGFDDIDQLLQCVFDHFQIQV